MLIQDLATDDPAPPYNEYPPSLSPHRFMGLEKFLAGRIQQMRAAKSFLATHPVWFDENPNLTCPRCGTGPASFQHAILRCLALTRVRDRLLQEVSSLAHDATTWSDPLLIRALGEYITDTKTGFPRTCSPPSIPPPLLPQPEIEKHMVSRGVLLFEFPTLWLAGCLNSFRKNSPCKKGVNEK